MRGGSSIYRILLVVGSVLAMLPNLSAIMAVDPIPSIWADRSYISLGGTELIERAASVRFIGEDVPRVGGVLGGYTWIGDINGDGLNDTAISAPRTIGLSGHEEDGTIYVFYGGGDPLSGTIDLSTAVPDLKILTNTPLYIRGGLALTSQISCGDYNDDGYRDLAFCKPYVGAGSTGSIYYGTAGGWPSEIVVPDDDADFNATMLWFCGPYSTSMDAQAPFFMETADVDHDGIDDLVYGGHFDDFYNPRRWNATIAWGGYTEGSDGSHVPDITFTALEDKNSLSTFGSSLDIGDIDGDGWTDMAVGAPLKTPDVSGLTQSGEVYIYFNISKLKGRELIRWDTVEHKTISGSGEYDRFGYFVEVRDLDGDGSDDIVCSAPYADGPGDDQTDCGEVFIFKGGPASSFPERADAESRFDLMVLGPAGTEGYGSKLGLMVRFGDVTGDGEDDLVAGLIDMDLPPSGSDTRSDAGIVLVYDHLSVLGQGQGAVQLTYPSKLFTLEGMNIEDGLGYHISVGDIDDDGIGDLLVSAPNADGLNDTRPRCGEAYIIYSTHLRLWDQTIGGPGYSDGCVFASQGKVRIETAVINERPEEAISSVRLELGPYGRPIVLECSSQGAVLTDPYGCIDPEGISFTMPASTRTSSFAASFEMGWTFPLRKGNDVRMTIRDSEGCVVSRTYRDAFVLAKDLSFEGAPMISSGGVELPGHMSWLGFGDPVEFGSIPVVFTGHPGRTVQEMDVDVKVGSSQGTFLVPYGPEWTFSDVVRSAPAQSYQVGIALHDAPSGADPSLLPVLEDGRRISVNVDGTPPLTPRIESMVPPEGRADVEGQPGRWGLLIGGSLGISGDAGGSGVRHFMVQDSTGSFIAMEKGGLFGTYYADADLGEQVLNLTDEVVDFDWGKWGPHPETFTVPPYGFSARWHGWISTDSDATVRFQLSGRGVGALYFDGKAMIPYDDLEYAPKGEVVEMLQDVMHEVELYYRHTDLSATPAFRFKWTDPNGSLSTVPASVLHHPSNSTNVTITAEDPSMTVTAVDWVGLSSAGASYEADIDAVPPVIDASSIPRWTRTTNLAVNLSISDEGSGVDRSSIHYRLLRDGEDYGTWSADGISFISTADPSVLNMSVMLSLERDLSGTIEVTCSDLAGNTARTGRVPIGHDRFAPVADLYYPVHGSVFRSPSANVTFLLKDTLSGIDQDSLTVRCRLNASDWFVLYQGAGEDVQELMVSVPMDLLNGLYTFEVSADDAVGNHMSGEFYFTVQVPPTNRPPVAHIEAPGNNSRFLKDWPFILDATGTRDDGLGLYDPVKLNWYSNISGYLGSGLSIKVNLDPGFHLITLYADDGEFNVSAHIAVLIVEGTDGEGGGGGGEPDGGSDLGIVLAAFITIVLVAVVIAVLVMRHRYQSSNYAEE